MADTDTPLFQQIADQNTPKQPGVFEQLGAPTADSAPNRYSTDQTQTTAGLAALAKQKLNLADFAPQDNSSLQTLVADNKSIIEGGQEKQLRAQVAQAAKQDAVDRNLKLQSDLVNNPDPGLKLLSLPGQVDKGFALQGAQPDHDALEDQGIAQLQLTAAQDPDQAALMSTLVKTGSTIHQMHDNAVKMELFGREVDALQQSVQNEGWFDKAGDFARSLWPTATGWARAGNVPGANAGFFDLPATQENKEATALWNMPLGDFKKNLPSVMDNFTKVLGGFGHDNAKGLEIARQYYAGGLNNSDRLSANFWDTVDAASVLPIGTFMDVARSASKVARVVGNRVASTDIVAGDLAKDIHGVADPAHSLQNPALSVEESIPASLAAGAIRPDIGIPADVARRLNETKATVQAIQDVLPRVSRLEPAQLKEAVDRAVKDAQARYTDEIADTKQDLTTAPNQTPFPKITEAKSAMAERAGPPADQGLVVARRMPDGSIKYGKPGDLHFDLLDNDELERKSTGHVGIDEADMGFARPGGPFMSREEAANSLGQGGRLESVKYREGQPAPFGKRGEQVPQTGLFDPEADLDHLSYVNARGEVYTGHLPDEAGEVGGIRLPHELTKDKDTGIYSLNLYLGKKSSAGGFLTEKGAQNAAIRKGLGSFETHQNSDGQWFVKVRQPVTETGIAQPVLTRADFKGVYSQAQYLKSFDNIMPELFNRARITQTLGKSKMIEEVFKPYVNNIKTLSSKSRRLVAKVAAAQEDAQRWFNHGEFEDAFLRGAGRMPTDKESLAFYSARELSDLNWHTFNNEVYIQKARRGLETVGAKNPAIDFDTGKVNGKVVPNPDFDKLRVFDVDEGKHYPAGSATDALKEKFATGKYRVLDLESPIKNPGDDPVKTLIAHESTSTVEPLARDQLGYVEGGSRENRFKWFVKQANQGSFKDGTKYWDRPITHIAARTHVQAEEWATAMERARLAYNDKTLSEAEKRLIIDRSPAESYDRFSSMIEKGDINPDHPFETLFDKEQPRAMTKIGDKDANWSSSDETAQEQYMISKGRMYYSKKGERLKDPSGNYAEILDPYTTLNRAMENAAQTSAFSDYNRKVMEEWGRVAQPYLDKNSISGSSDPYSVFMNGKVSPDLLRSKGGQAFANQLEMVRNTHKRFMFGQNPEQRLTYTASRRFADWVETKGKWGQYFAGAAYDKMSANPVAAAKGYVYDVHIGFFNPTRLWLHTQTAALAIMQHPIYGWRSMAMMPWVEHAMMNGSENVLDYYAKNLSAFHGLEPDDWKQMVRSLKGSGWLNVSGEQLMLDQYMGRLGGSAFKKGVDNVRDWGRIFQNISERFNRVNAYQIAWHKTRDALPEMAGDSAEFQSRVNREADMLDNNMTSSSQAWWQRGPTSVPTQFMAYQTRMLERILPKVLGGSSEVSAAQKFRLAAGGMLLYGAGGAPGGKEFLDWVKTEYAKANEGKPMSADTQREFGRGVYDTAIHQLSGGKLDTDISSRAGLGGFTDDLYDKLTNGDMNSVLGVLGGPIGETAGDTWKAINKMVLYAKAEQTGTTDSRTWALIAGDAAKQISTVNNGLKAYWVWKTGQLRDMKTGEPITSEDQMYAITHALGIPSFSEVDRWDIIAHNKDREADIKDLGKTLAGIRRNAFQAMADGDEEKQTYYNNLAAGVMQQFHNDPLLMQQAAQEANKELSRSGFSYDQLKIQSARETGIQPVEAGDETQE